MIARPGSCIQHTRPPRPGRKHAQVQLIYVVVPLVMAAMSGLGTRAARCFGRAQAMRGLQSAGIVQPSL